MSPACSHIVGGAEELKKKNLSDGLETRLSSKKSEVHEAEIVSNSKASARTHNLKPPVSLLLPSTHARVAIEIIQVDVAGGWRKRVSERASRTAAAVKTLDAGIGKPSCCTWQAATTDSGGSQEAAARHGTDSSSSTSTAQRDKHDSGGQAAAAAATTAKESRQHSGLAHVAVYIATPWYRLSRVHHCLQDHHHHRL